MKLKTQQLSIAERKAATTDELVRLTVKLYLYAAEHGTIADTRTVCMFMAGNWNKQTIEAMHNLARRARAEGALKSL